MENKRVRNYYTVSVLLIFLSWVFLTGLAFADTLQTHEYAVTATASWETTPRLGNDGASDLVVFTRSDIMPDGTMGRGDIWFQRLVSGAPLGTPIQITSGPQDNELNDVSGDYIVYTAYDSVTSLSGRIMVYQISTTLLYGIGSALVIQEPRISGQKVVWREGGAYATMVMLYDLAWLGTARDADILAGPIPPTYSVDIGDRFVVWLELSNSQYDLVAYDLAAGVRIGVTATVATVERDPSTSGAWIVWEALDKGVAAARIVARNLDSSEERVVADSGVLNYRPSIDGDLIAYESMLTGNLDIFVYRISTGETFQVTTDPADQYLNDVFGQSIAYVDERTGTQDIYVSDLVFVTEPVNNPPVANAGPDQNIYLGQTAWLNGSASSDANGDPLTYSWTLDTAPAGSSAALVDASTMTPSLTPDVVGAYHIVLVVNDGQADSAASPVLISVSLNLPPVALATGTPVSGNAPLQVTFNAIASYDPEGSALTYYWNFGDPDSGANNTSTLITPNHTYATAGTYTAVVTVTDNLGKTDQASVEVTVTAPNLPPVVLPTATPNNGAAPLNVQFAANATDVNPDDVLIYSWDFGDPDSGASNTSPLVNPLHTYFSAGTYTVTVMVSDGVNLPVSAGMTISVSSALTIHVTEAKVERGKKGKVEGKISMKADFVYEGMPATTDVILVKFDGVTLVEVPFGSFKQESAGKYEYETKTLEAEIDFNRGTIKVSDHKMLTGGVDNSNGIDVEVSFGSATGMDHIDMKGEKDKEDGDLSHKR